MKRGIRGIKSDLFPLSGGKHDGHQTGEPAEIRCRCPHVRLARTLLRA